MSSQRDSPPPETSGPIAPLDDGIDTREAFDAKVQALAVRAIKEGAYVPLVETPITSVEQITDDVLDQLGGAGPVNPDDVKEWSIGRDTGRPPRFRTEELLQQWRKEPVPDPSEHREELLYRRGRLRETLTKLVRRGRDVSTIINTLERARWDYLLLIARRGHPDRPLRTDRRHPRTRLQVTAERALTAVMDVLQERPTRKTEHALMTATDAMQALVLHHVDADRLVRNLCGPGTLEEFLSGETRHLYPQSEPARRYLAVMHAAQDVRRALRTASPPHQLDAVRHAVQDARRALRANVRLRPPARPVRNTTPRQSASNKAAHH